MTLSAYRQAVARAETPRSTEYRLISEITGEMLAAKEAGLSGALLMDPLHRNREMWNVFSTDCGAAGNGLPDAVRAQIVSLALFVDRFTSEVMAGRETIEELIEINKMIMEGLRPQRMAA